jgi:hypothetical protein
MRRLAATSMAVLALGAFAPTLRQCTPAPHCDTISWPGRSPVCVVGVDISSSTATAQRLLDARDAVDITGNTDPSDGYSHVAGHHHGIFAAGDNLHVGTIVTYAGERFRVVGDTVAYAGSAFSFRRGLTVQYSLTGGAVRLVFCDPA